MGTFGSTGSLDKAPSLPLFITQLPGRYPRCTPAIAGADDPGAPGRLRVGALRNQRAGPSDVVPRLEADELRIGKKTARAASKSPEITNRERIAYFGGLLPEGRVRQRITRQLKVREDDDAGLLFAIGRDCAGAPTVLPEGEEPSQHRETRRPITDEELLTLIQSRGITATGHHRFSLAGAQDKVAVIEADGRYWHPSATDPSSHILKFETLPWVCFAEHMGNELADRSGLTACEIRYVETDAAQASPYLKVTRFDRRPSGPVQTRLHQEDIAQALGHSSETKYEQDGGPSLGQVGDLLRRHVANPVLDISRLRDWQLFNYLIGNSDGHAKNLALLYEPSSAAPRLAPFYDLVCIEFFNRIGSAQFDRLMAFAVGERSVPEEIRRVDWEGLARSMHVAPPGLMRRLEELAGTLPTEASEARAAFAAQFVDNPIYDRWVETIHDRCRWVQNNVLRRT